MMRFVLSRVLAPLLYLTTLYDFFPSTGANGAFAFHLSITPPSMVLMIGKNNVQKNGGSFDIARKTPRLQHNGLCFYPDNGRLAGCSSCSTIREKQITRTATALFAKKKAANAKLAALEALEALEENVNGAAADAPLSKKEQKELEKRRKAEEKKRKKMQQKEEKAEADAEKKNARSRAMNALEELKEGGGIGGEGTKPMSKKEAKLAARAQAKKEEKKAKAVAKKEAKKLEREQQKQEQQQRSFATEDAEAEAFSGAVDGLSEVPAQEIVNGKIFRGGKVAQEDGAQSVLAAAGDDEVKEEVGISKAAQEQIPVKKEKMTLEERIRKERPPPRVRVMEGVQPGYVSLRLEDVSVTFRNQEVLKGVTWGVQTGERVGLVGANGGGKTTQLRILAGEMDPTSGDVVKSSRDLRVAILRQEFVDELVPERSLKDEFMSVFAEEKQILDELREAEKNLEESAHDDQDAMQEILDRMTKLQSRADAKDVYSLESRVQKVMDLMGFQAEEATDSVSMFSGGWKMRIGLGKVLLKDPNVLMLDEPTNHLDLESVEWLEDFLRNQNIPMIIVSHDREFLDQVCTKIVDTEGGISSEYNGNYSRFLKLKKSRMDAWNAAYKAQEKKIKEERQWINKFRAKQPVAVKQREAKLEKLIKSKDYVQKPPFIGKPFRFRFPDAPRLSPEVAEVVDLSHSYGNGANRLFDQCDLEITKGDRISILGPNGSGKSTLLRFIVGKEEPDKGHARIVGANVVANYFEQNQADVLDLDKTVSETVQAASNGQSYNELRALLGQFLFKGDSVDKKVANLSGGEKARLSLCCMMLRPANLLILDEPTNHLDIPAKEMLEEALQHFQGSVLVISHDRYFISKVATTIVAIEDKKLNRYDGDYKFYMDRTENVRAKIEGRYVKGVEKIGSAPVIDLEELAKPKRNFGGAKTANLVSRKDKGVKNAKRMYQR